MDTPNGLRVDVGHGNDPDTAACMSCAYPAKEKIFFNCHTGRTRDGYRHDTVATLEGHCRAKYLKKKGKRKSQMAHLHRWSGLQHSSLSAATLLHLLLFLSSLSLSLSLSVPTHILHCDFGFVLSADTLPHVNTFSFPWFLNFFSTTWPLLFHSFSLFSF